MKVFLVERTDRVWCTEDCDMVVIAKDEKRAESCARARSKDFKEATLKVTEIKLDSEKVVLVAELSDK